MNPNRIFILQIQKHSQTAKHKKSEKAIAKKLRKFAKVEKMETDDSSSIIEPLNEEEKQKLKEERKKQNRTQNHYKKINYSITSKIGHRAV